MEQKKSVKKVFQEQPVMLVGNYAKKNADEWKKLAESDKTILLNGPPGCGKEMIARFIYNHRRKGRFAVLNSREDTNILFVELFGVSGTVADVTERKGLIELVGDGVLLLDEIDSFPSKMQSGLNRLLEYRKYRPAGGSDNDEVEKTTNALIILTSNLQQHELENAVRTDWFRRFRVVDVPSLPDRDDDALKMLLFYMRDQRNNNLSCKTTSALIPYSIIKRLYSDMLNKNCSRVMELADELLREREIIGNLFGEFSMVLQELLGEEVVFDIASCRYWWNIFYELDSCGILKRTDNINKMLSSALNNASQTCLDPDIAFLGTLKDNSRVINLIHDKLFRRWFRVVLRNNRRLFVRTNLLGGALISRFAERIPDDILEGRYDVEGLRWMLSFKPVSLYDDEIILQGSRSVDCSELRSIEKELEKWGKEKCSCSSTKGCIKSSAFGVLWIKLKMYDMPNNELERIWGQTMKNINGWLEKGTTPCRSKFRELWNKIVSLQ